MLVYCEITAMCINDKLLEFSYNLTFVLMFLQGHLACQDFFNLAAKLNFFSTNILSIFLYLILIMIIFFLYEYSSQKVLSSLCYQLSPVKMDYFLILHQARNWWFKVGGKILFSVLYIKLEPYSKSFFKTICNITSTRL